MQAITFHCLDILARDEVILAENEESAEVTYDDGSDDDAEFMRRHSRSQTTGIRSQLIFHMIGRTLSGDSIKIDVEGYRPYFYVAAPEHLSPRQMPILQKQLADYLERASFGRSRVSIRLEFREKFYGFTNHTAFPFFRLTVNSLKDFQGLRRLFLDGDNRPQVRGGSVGAAWGRGSPAVYEANIDPMLRFIHERNIQPCGWVRCTADESMRVAYTDIEGLESGPAAAAPFKLISWDIECFSAGGDFPKAKRDYALAAKEICKSATDGRMAVEIVERMLFDDRTLRVKSPFSADARANFSRVMNRDAVHRDIERHIASYKNTTNAEGRDEVLGALTTTLNALLGNRFPLAGDPCIQIGNVVSVNGVVTERHLFAFPNCAPIDGVTVHAAPDEATMLRQWFEWMEYTNPDILIGYNVWRFDESYVWERAEELGLTGNPSFQALNRLEGEMKLNELFLSSSALGDNKMYMFNSQGRLEVDMFYYIKPRQNLPSYKLDSVAQFYMSGALTKAEALAGGDKATLKVKGSSVFATPGRAIQLLDDESDAITEKLVVLENRGDGQLVVAVGARDAELWNEDVTTNAAKWVIVKDDVSPADLFRLHCGSATDRATIGRYCIQDCDLVLDLYKKLEVFMNSMAMANICSVPVRYIFTRGQGIKIESLIFKECTALNKCIVTLPNPNRAGTEESYEGAIVLTPVPGLYNRSPIGVADFASLYPSSIVSENISHDTLLWSKDFTADGRLVRTTYGSAEYAEAADDAGNQVEWTDIQFDLWITKPGDTRKNPEKVKNGYRVCRYAQDQPGTLPIIIKKLLAARNAKKKEMGREEDPARKVLLDAEQLSYKLTANSLYGQLGSGTFKVRLQDLAASTTAYGRKQIMFAKEVIDRFYGPASGNPHCAANIMYGDTDSLFIEFNPRDPVTGLPLEGRSARAATIELTEEAGKLVSQVLKSPHDFEFDKVYHPFMIFAKKRYVGKLYEANPDDCYLMSMGMSIKRRDYAPILKVIMRKAIDEIMDRNDVEAAMEHCRRGAMDLVEGKTKTALLLLSMSLKADYADPERIAHKVLADRMAARDPGSAPSVGDRVDYLFIVNPSAKLKGDRIENPTYIKENNIPIDYSYYIQKQLWNPIGQLFGPLLERMSGFREDMLPSNFDELKQEKQLDVRSELAAQLLFGPALAVIERAAKQKALTKMFGGRVTVERKAVTATSVAAPAAAAAPTKRPQQGRLTNYFINKQILETVGTTSKRKTRSRESSISNGSASSKGSAISRK